MGVASVVPVDLHSAFYPGGVQSSLWHLSRSHQWHGRWLESDSQQNPFTHEGLLSHARTKPGCRKTRRGDRADVVPQDLQSVQCLPRTGSTSAAAPPDRHTSVPPRGARTSLSGGRCTGCRRQCPGLSFSVVLLFNVLCEKSCSVGAVYIVNKTD